MKKLTLSVVSLIFLLGIGLIAFSGSSDKTQSQSQVLGGQDFIQTYQETPEAVYMDVRTPAEYNTGHLNGAINVDFDNRNFVTEIQKLDKSKPYFVYCRSGNRSGQAVAIMKKQGFQNIHDLRGGIAGNQSALTLVAGNQ